MDLTGNIKMPRRRVRRKPRRMIWPCILRDKALISSSLTEPRRWSGPPIAAFHWVSHGICWATLVLRMKMVDKLQKKSTAMPKSRKKTPVTMRGSARPLTERIPDKARSENPSLYLYKFSSRSSTLSISSSMSAMRSSLWITSFSIKSRSLVIRPPPSWRNNDVRIPTAAHSTRRMSMAKWIQIGILLIRNFKCLLSWTALANGNMEATKKMKPRGNPSANFSMKWSQLQC